MVNIHKTKTQLPDPIDKFLLPVFRESGITPLPHSDPFDLLLVVQAMVKKLPIISSDEQLDAYEVERIW